MQPTTIHGVYKRGPEVCFRVKSAWELNRHQIAPMAKLRLYFKEDVGARAG
jgi:hypothetical protein